LGKDREGLAVLFLKSGDVARAASEFEKLSLLPHRADAAVYAGVCWQVAGDSARADSLIAGAGLRLGLSRGRLQESVARLRASMPGR
jgi:hypothetical protein